MKALTTEELRRAAPAVFTEAPSPRLSDVYRPLATYEAIEILGREGWYPVDASQVHSRKVGEMPFAKHLVRFAQDDGHPDRAPSIAILNSHDGTTSLRVFGGFIRFACANGMIVGSYTETRRRHAGDFDFETEFSAALDAIELGHRQAGDMGQRTLTVAERMDFAVAALEVNRTPKTDDAILSILAPRRLEDYGDDLWRTFNVIQENSIRGGVTFGRSDTGRLRTTRAIRDGARDTQINEELWSLAASYL